MSAFPGQRLRADGFSVQGIADLHAHREFILAFPFIMNVFAVVLPDQAAVSALREFLVALGVFDVGKFRAVDDRPVRPAIAQHCLHRHLADFAVRSGLDIDRLFLVPVGLFLLLLRRGLGRLGRRRPRGHCGRRSRGGLGRRFRGGGRLLQAAARQQSTAEEHAERRFLSVFHFVSPPSGLGLHSTFFSARSIGTRRSRRFSSSATTA